MNSTQVRVTVPEGIDAGLITGPQDSLIRADTPVGPYEAEYTPTKSIEITVDNPSDVQVTENGDKVGWDSKTSGVGRVTITVPQTTSPSAATDETASSDSDDSSSDSDTSN